jgi:molybdopterin/thiamine biosynthesis adenylyltransferase
MNARLEVPGQLWDKIRTDLLSTPRLERAGVGFAGRAAGSPSERLLLRDWTPVPAEAYLVQLGGHLQVSPVFWAHAAKRARETREAIVILHSHPRDEGVPTFSRSDDAGERTLIPKIRARAPVPIAAVVVSPGGEEARLWAEEPPNGTPLRVRKVGEFQVPHRGAPSNIRFDRQIRALGSEGHASLRSLRVGVVGAGGLGSHVIQQLIHLGIGEITVLDPDRVAESNLSRLVGATSWDARLRSRKVRIARRLAASLSSPTRILRVHGSVLEEKSAHHLLNCDVIFGCTDNEVSRTVLNAMAFQYYVPVLDLGVEIQRSGSMGGRVVWLAPGQACLWCMGILDPERIRIEQLPSETLTDEIARGYVEGLGEPAPAVVSINGVVASIAVTELLARVTSFAGTAARSNLFLYRVSENTVRRSSPLPLESCLTCSSQGILGSGQLASFPWR